MTTTTQRKIIVKISPIFMVFICPFYSGFFISFATKLTNLRFPLMRINPIMNGFIFCLISFPIMMVFIRYFLNRFSRMFFTIKRIKNTFFSTRFAADRRTPNFFSTIKTYFILLGRHIFICYYHNTITAL